MPGTLAEIRDRREEDSDENTLCNIQGERVVELFEDIDLPKDIAVLVVIPEQEDEKELRSQLWSAAEAVFAKLWDNEEDKVWNEYL
ncbi:MAG: hypothetical protein WBW48_21045 [Anaerolineae bacterium]